MNLVLLKMLHLEDDPAIWHDATLPNITTLKSLSSTIQKAFALGSDGVIEYEVLGCRAPGGRARLRDLITSGITRFRYRQSGVREQYVEIVIVPLSRSHLERSAAESKEQQHGTGLRIPSSETKPLCGRA